jgi:hypothetical protein
MASLLAAAAYTTLSTLLTLCKAFLKQDSTPIPVLLTLAIVELAEAKAPMAPQRTIAAACAAAST